MGKAIFSQKAARREIRNLQRRGAAVCFPVGNKPQLALENKADLLIVVAAGEYGLMLVVGFYMAVIKENRMLLLSKNRKYRQLRQCSQKLLPGEPSAVLLVEMNLWCGNIVPLQHGADGVSLLPYKTDELFPLCLGVQIGSEGVKGGRGIVLGNIDVPHGFHSSIRIVICKVLR